MQLRRSSMQNKRYMSKGYWGFRDTEGNKPSGLGFYLQARPMTGQDSMAITR